MLGVSFFIIIFLPVFLYAGYMVGNSVTSDFKGYTHEDFNGKIINHVKKVDWIVIIKRRILRNFMLSTEHGSKGEKYDNVLFFISKGWSLYKFDEYLHQNNESTKEYIRNRDLFLYPAHELKVIIYLRVLQSVPTLCRKAPGTSVE